MSARGRWVLLRGLTRAAGHWADFPTALAAANPDLDLVTPDLPGCGVRHREAAPASVAGLLAEVRRELPAGGPLWLLGLSLGGMVVHEWMRQHPDEVTGAVLINTSLGGLSPSWQRLRPAAAAAVVGAALTRDHLARERRLVALVSSRAEDVEVTARSWAALALAQPVSRATALRQIWAAAAYRPDPAPAPPSVLVLASVADRMVHPTCSRIVAHRLRAHIREHPTAGHDLPLDEPGWVIDQVGAWRRRSETEL